MLLCLLATCVSATAGAAEPWEIDVCTTEESIATFDRGEATIGYTDVVPPSSLPQSFRTERTADGYAWRLWGTELSAWQTLPIPDRSRYLLKWRFVYEGRIVEGRGRTGFIFGDPASANLLSLEVTHAGSLRLVRWGRQNFDNLGRIVWSRRMWSGGRGTVRIEAEYDIRDDTLVCSVDGGAPVRILLREHMPSAPMTLRGVGFFAAVPEATRVMSGNPRRIPYEDIDLSRKFTRVEHVRLSVQAD